MSESMPGWGEFQSALSQLQSVAGGGPSGGGGSSSGVSGAGLPRNTPVSISVGPGSGVWPEGVEALIGAGFRGDPHDHSETLYGTTGQLGSVPDYPRAYLPPSAIHLPAGAQLAEDITAVPRAR